MPFRKQCALPAAQYRIAALNPKIAGKLLAGDKAQGLRIQRLAIGMGRWVVAAEVLSMQLFCRRGFGKIR